MVIYQCSKSAVFFFFVLFCMKITGAVIQIVLTNYTVEIVINYNFEWYLLENNLTVATIKIGFWAMLRILASGFGEF